MPQICYGIYNYVYNSVVQTLWLASADKTKALSQAEYPTLYVVLEDSCFHLQWKHTHAHTQQSLDIDREIAHNKIHGIVITLVCIYAHCINYFTIYEILH